MITSIHNQRVRQVHALQTQPRRRRREGRIVLEGLRLVQDAIAAGHQPDYILHTADHPPPCEPALPVTENVMRHLSDTQQPQGIIGVFPLPRIATPAQPARVLILDAIRDPGNLGTLLRTAAAAGVQAVITAPGCVDPYNPKVLRAGMGAHFRVALAEMDWAQITAYCAGLRVYLADSQGDARYDRADWSPGWALITGSEAHGASSEAQRSAQQRVYIPMAAATESLNAAIATAVILFEAQRQQS
jgi:TrmH family RNA methyltransferase